MTINIKRLASGFLALALMLGGMIIPASGTVWADTLVCSIDLEAEACLASTAEELSYGISNSNISIISLGADITTNNEVSVNRDLQLNLAGHTLTGGVQKDTIKVYAGSTLNINNGNVVGYKTNSSAIFNNGIVNATNVNFTVDESATPFYVLTNHGIMTLNDCTATRTTSGGSSVVENGYASYNSGSERTGYVIGVNTQYPKMIINGGNYTLVSGGGVEVIKTDDGADTVINAGIFTANENTTGWLLQLSGRSLTINGGTFTSDGDDANAIVYWCDGGSINTCVFNITGGTFNAQENVIYNRSNYSYEDFGAATINITGGTFAGSQITGLVGKGKFAYYDSMTEKYTVSDVPVVTGFAANYDVVAGDQLVLNYVLTPNVIGNWIDVSSMEENDLCGKSEILTDCIEFDEETRTLSVDPDTAPGVHHMRYSSVGEFAEGDFTVTVLPPIYDENELYGVRVGGYYYYGGSYDDGVTVAIADETIAKFKTLTEKSGDDEYTHTVIAGVKSGETVLNYVYDGKVVKSIPIKVYDIATTMKRAQIVGTSQTFTIDVTEGYKIVNFSVSAADSWSSEEENAEKSVEGLVNKDGTYTILVNRMPVWTHYGDDEIKEEKSPYIYASFTLEDKNGNRYEEGYGIMLFEFAATDEAAEAVNDEEDVAKNNEKVMRELTANVIAEAMLHADEVKDNKLELTLEDGTRVVISDVESFGEAFDNAETIEAVLTKPQKKAESEINDAEVAKLKSEMGSGKAGHRFVDVNVELRSGDKVFGKITDLKSPLIVSVNVSDDGDVPSGYTRKYFAVRYHDGQAKKISDVKYDKDKKIVSFGSDEFSTYLIAYTDEKDGDSIVVTDSSESKTTGSVTVYETAIIEEAETSGEITESETAETSGTSENKNNSKNSNDSESDKEDSSEGAPVFGVILGVVAVIAVIAFIVAMVRSRER